jgi:integrase
MSVRKRTWKNKATGTEGECWIVDYSDQHGKRRMKSFDKKKDADAWSVNMRVEVREGRHTPDSDSVTVVEAGKDWIKSAERERLERTTVEEYQRHLDLHIVPYLGAVKLSRLTVKTVKEFRNKLLDGTPAPGQENGQPRSPAMVKKIVTSLSSLLATAQDDGAVAQWSAACPAARKSVPRPSSAAS